MDAEAPAKPKPRWVKWSTRALEPLVERWFAPEVRGLEHLSPGPALLVSNHSGGFVTPDTWILTTTIYRTRGLADVPVGLVHDRVFEAPVVGSVLRRLGAVPASARGARKAFARGRKVLVYPGGDIDAFRPWRERDRVIFGERRGYVRLALRERVPIVPVVAAGAHEGWFVLTDGRRLAKLLHTHRWLRTDVLPVTLSIPWGLNPGLPYFPLPTRVLVEVLPPIRFEREGPEAASDDAFVEACHLEVHATMQRALDRLAAERRARGRFVRREERASSGSD
jgi:1-acyl-sn-glycerol-3-phosphate acyltransferase